MKLTKIGIFESCFKELFGIPRQSSLAPSVQGRITLTPPFDRLEMISDLDKFSHLWVIFGFHALKNSMKELHDKLLSADEIMFR